MDWPEVERILADRLPAAIGDARRILLIVPDKTRTAPVAEMVPRVLDVLYGAGRAADVILALGTHAPLPETEAWAHVGLDPATAGGRYPGLRVRNHEWNNPAALATYGEIPAARVGELTGGLLAERVPLTLNRAAAAYDLLLILGPVFPHELVGFSGGSKYLFPGISGHEMIDIAHWIGALRGSRATIGVVDTPIRRVLDEALRRLPFRTAAIKMVVHHGALAHLFVGPTEETWRRAAACAVPLHIERVPRPYRRVLACCPPMYPDLWTGGKCMYKCEGAVADGGELVIYAPHVTTFSEAHAATIERVGYHVRDYYLAHWDRYRDEPRAVLAYCVIMKGDGTYHDGVETPRIRVAVASQIPESKCRQTGIGYVDPATIDVNDWQQRDDVLVVEKAGETLYTTEATTSPASSV
jgi:nickel-dependent lactate racemase